MEGLLGITEGLCIMDGARILGWQLMDERRGASEA